jgi:hypothetical protein
MKKIDLYKGEHHFKVGDKCPYTEPNIQEDCLLYEDGQLIGFYIHDINAHSPKLCQLMVIANNEFRSDNVPKQEMSRGAQGSKKDKLERQKQGLNLVTQYSTTLGSRAPKPHMRMPYPSISAVHQVKSAKPFIKAMLLAAHESGKIMQQVAPELYAAQVQAINQVEPKWRFANLFTSSISNFNINADYHRDNANLKPTLNVIITKRNNSKGGALNVPDYNATFAQPDNSMLVYPAWRNLHGVTPIVATHEGGYRNSFVFYSLNDFKNT